MKTAFKYSLLGGIIGAVLMFAAVLVIEWQLDKHPALDKQVIDYLESQGYPVDTLDGNMYRFTVDGDMFVFDYYPDDQTYLHFFTIYGAEDYSRAEVEAACFKATRTKKNSELFPEETDEGMSVVVSSSSFLADDELDTDIVDRSIRVIQQAVAIFYRELERKEE